MDTTTTAPAFATTVPVLQIIWLNELCFSFVENMHSKLQ